MGVNLIRSVKWQLVLLVILTGLMLVACGSRAEDEAIPEGCDGVTWGSSVEVEERDGEYYALVGGDYPDSCSTICGIEQEVEGNNININIFSDKPEELLCSQMLTPFVEEVLLDTDGLEPGEYTVTVNEHHAMTTFTLS